MRLCRSASLPAVVCTGPSAVWDSSCSFEVDGTAGCSADRCAVSATDSAAVSAADVAIGRFLSSRGPQA
jgi:hypothetical protein